MNLDCLNSDIGDALYHILPFRPRMEHVCRDPLDEHWALDLREFGLRSRWISETGVEGNDLRELGWPLGSHSKSDGGAMVIACHDWLLQTEGS